MTDGMHRTADKPRLVLPVAIVAVIFPSLGVSSTDLSVCADIREDQARLQCYDLLAAPADGKTGEPAEPFSGELKRRPSLLRGRFVAEPHRPNFILGSYQHDPNVAPFLAEDPEADLQHQEIKFQISLKVSFWNDLIFGASGDRFGNGLDAWFGYTQQSFWQALNFDRSSPFRESNYEPEFGITYRNQNIGSMAPVFEIGALRFSSVSMGAAHQSNGRGGSLSRSWNRIWVLFDMEYRQWSFKAKPWFRIREAKADDNNPDIQEYIGRAELQTIYTTGKRRDRHLSVTWRNNLRARDNRSGYQVDWTFPFPWGEKFKAHVHFYNGYGESLIDHDVRVRRIGIGALVNDWK